MVSNALHNITNHLGVKILHGQSHQFTQIVGDEGDVDARCHMQNYPTTQKFNGHLCEEKYNLRNKYKCDKPDVFIAYSFVYDGLREKRK